MIKKDVPLSEEEKTKIRNEWPFKEMEIGDSIDVEIEDEWPEARKYAHMFASKKGWKVTTKWLPVEGIGRIRRIK